MEDFLKGGVQALREARADAKDVQKKEDDVRFCEKDIKLKEKDITAHKNFTEDKITSTIRRRRNSLEKAHDEIIAKAEKDLKNAKRNRFKVKEGEVKSRITNETEALTNENKALEAEVNKALKAAHLPRMCKSKLYEALFQTKTVTEYFVLLFFILGAFVIVPNIVCLVFVKEKFIAKVIEYAITVLIFVAIYFAIFVPTRIGEKTKTLNEIRPKMDKVHKNEKEIKHVIKRIKNDKSEEHYDLEDCDSEIERCQEIVDTKNEDKDNALKNFDEVTAVELRSEIEAENVPIIQGMEKEKAALLRELENLKEIADYARTQFIGRYAGYLGEKNMSCEKIDELIKIMEEGNATTIMQALSIQSGEITLNKNE